MRVDTREHAAGFEIFTVTAGDSVFELSAYGGQLLSWEHGGVPVMFANREHAILDGKAAYRGGAPICFPHFGRGNLLPSEPISPQHGRARNSIWEAEIGESAIVLRTEQPSPDGFGPTTLALELTYRFGDGLDIEGKITNLGEKASPFQLAVHSYWACQEPAAARVTGLGERFLDNLHGLSEARDEDSAAPHVPPVDRVYLDPAAAQDLDTGGFRLRITTEGCAGAVLWNPGPTHEIADLGSPDFICLESGVISPARSLAPGEEHRLKIGYRLV